MNSPVKVKAHDIKFEAEPNISVYNIQSLEERKVKAFESIASTFRCFYWSLCTLCFMWLNSSPLLAAHSHLFFGLYLLFILCSLIAENKLVTLLKKITYK